MKQDIKKAIESAEKELKQEAQNKTKKEVKSIIKAILEKTEKAQEKRQEAVKEIQIHKKMLDYLKKGDLEKIREMLETDEFAKKIAVIIIKEKETIREKEVPLPYYPNPWDKWRITWNDNEIYSTTIDNDRVTIGNSGDGSSYLGQNTYSGTEFRNFTGGSYQCSSGKVYHISK